MVNGFCNENNITFNACHVDQNKHRCTTSIFNNAQNFAFHNVLNKCFRQGF